MGGHEMVVRKVEFVGLTRALALALAGVEGVAGERGDRTPLALWRHSLLLLSPGKHTQSPPDLV